MTFADLSTIQGTLFLIFLLSASLLLLVNLFATRIRLAYDKRNKDHGSKYYEYAALAESQGETNGKAFRKNYAQILNHNETFFKIKTYVTLGLYLGAVLTNGIFGWLWTAFIAAVVLMIIGILVADRIKHGKVETFEEKVEYYANLSPERRNQVLELIGDHPQHKEIFDAVNLRIEQDKEKANTADNFSFTENSLDTLASTWRK